MKLIPLLLCSILLSFSAQSQINHFIYLQTEHKQAFYVKLNDKLYSSSASGYLIIPTLSEGAYALTIGFPKNEWPVKQYNVQVGAKDAGYLIKNFEKDGWALFNLQTMDIVRAHEKKAADIKNNEQPVGFTEALSQVSEIKKPVSTPVQVTEITTPPKDSVIVVKPADPVIPKLARKEEKITIPEKVIKEEIVEKPGLASLPRQLTSQIKNDTRYMVYIVEEAGKSDTVDITLDYSGQRRLKTGIEQDATETIIDAASTVKNDVAAKKKPAFIDLPVSTLTDTSAKEKKQPVERKPELSKEAASIVTNQDCRNLATNQDFLDLRKQMAAVATAEEMMDIARKEMKRNCYSALQVKNLSVLFLDDKGRYGFLDLAYVYTSDQHNYKQLRGLLTDEYYLRRFDAMIR